MCVLTTVESQLMEMLGEGKDANALIALLDDDTVVNKTVALHLIEAGADIREIARVTSWEAGLCLAATFLERGVDADWLVEKIGARLDYHYYDRTFRMVVDMVRLAADYGVKADTVARLMKENKDYAQDILLQIDYLYERGCKLDIDECLKDKSITFGMLGKDIKKVIDVGYPLEKITYRCAAESELSPGTVETLVAYGANVSIIVTHHPELVVKYPRSVGMIGDPEALYLYMRSDSDYDALIGEFGMRPKQIAQGIVNRRDAHDLNAMLEPLLRNGLRPRDYAEIVVRARYTRGVVRNFKLLKQYDPGFDLDPKILYYIAHPKWVRDLLDYEANREAVLRSAMQFILASRRGWSELLEEILDWATVEEAHWLLAELPPTHIGCALVVLVNYAGFEREELARIVEEEASSRYPLIEHVTEALPTLCAREVPIKREVLEMVVTDKDLSVETTECLVKYGLRPSELAEHMDLYALKANIESLAEDGYNPDRLAATLVSKGVDLTGEICERLKKAGAKLWV